MNNNNFLENRMIDRNSLEDFMYESHPFMMEDIDRISGKIRKYALIADEKAIFPMEILKGEKEKIMNMTMVPVSYGGQVETATALRRTIISEKLGFSDPALAISMPGPGIGMPPVIAIGTESQKTEYFNLFRKSESFMWGSFATSEKDSGSDAYALKLEAKREGDYYVLNGKKDYIGSADRSSIHTVYANTNFDKGRFGIRAFILNSNTPGLTVSKVHDMYGLRSIRFCELSFNDCVIHKTKMLGYIDDNTPLKDSFSSAQNAWDFMRPLLSSIMVGCSDYVLTLLKEHLESDNMNQYINKNKNEIMSITKNMSFDIERCRMLCIKAAILYDRGIFMSKEASMAKFLSAKIAQKTINSAIDILTIDGIMNDKIFEKLYRDIKAFDIMEGTGDIQSLMICKMHKNSNRNFSRLVKSVVSSKYK